MTRIPATRRFSRLARARTLINAAVRRGIKFYTSASSKSVLVIDRPHIDALDCWCGPSVERECDTCHADPLTAAACEGCMGRGWVPCDDWQDYTGPQRALIVTHNYVEAAGPPNADA